MNSINDDQNSSSSSSEIDICNSSPNSFRQTSVQLATSTPHAIYKPRVNFHSIESLVTSSFSSPLSLQRHDDTGYSSLNSSALILDKSNKENLHHSITETSCKRKSRRKLTDWQIWHLRQAYTNNRYPLPCEQEQMALQLVLPLSSIRIWFQNYRARSGRN